MSVALTLDTLLDVVRDRAQTSGFVEGYKALSGANELPRLTDCLTGVLFPFLDNCTVFETLGEMNMTYRFCGSSVAERLGIDVTGGNLLDFLPSPMREAMYEDMCGMLAQPCGNFAHYRSLYKSGKSVETETISLPVQSDTSAEKRYILAFHAAQRRFENDAPQEETQIGMEWMRSDFIDLGHGVIQSSAPIPYNVQR